MIARALFGLGGGSAAGALYGVFGRCQHGTCALEWNPVLPVLAGAALGLFVVLAIAIRLGALKRPGLSTGLFGTGYALARIFSEFFRQPDAQLGFLFGGATMGMLLSLPLLAIGLALIAYALRPRRRPAALA